MTNHMRTMRGSGRVLRDIVNEGMPPFVLGLPTIACPDVWDLTQGQKPAGNITGWDVRTWYDQHQTSAGPVSLDVELPINVETTPVEVCEQNAAIMLGQLRGLPRPGSSYGFPFSRGYRVDSKRAAYRRADAMAVTWAMDPAVARISFDLYRFGVSLSDDVSFDTLLDTTLDAALRVASVVDKPLEIWMSPARNHTAEAWTDPAQWSADLSRVSDRLRAVDTIVLWFPRSRQLPAGNWVEQPWRHEWAPYGEVIEHQCTW